jgi:hypothetical protein
MRIKIQAQVILLITTLLFCQQAKAQEVLYCQSDFATFYSSSLYSKWEKFEAEKLEMILTFDKFFQVGSISYDEKTYSLECRRLGNIRCIDERDSTLLYHRPSNYFIYLLGDTRFSYVFVGTCKKF